MKNMRKARFAYTIQKNKDKDHPIKDREVIDVPVDMARDPFIYPFELLELFTEHVHNKYGEDAEVVDCAVTVGYTSSKTTVTAVLKEAGKVIKS